MQKECVVEAGSREKILNDEFEVSDQSTANYFQCSQLVSLKFLSDKRTKFLKQLR